MDIHFNRDDLLALEVSPYLGADNGAYFITTREAATMYARLSWGDLLAVRDHFHKLAMEVHDRNVKASLGRLAEGGALVEAGGES